MIVRMFVGGDHLLDQFGLFFGKFFGDVEHVVVVEITIVQVLWLFVLRWRFSIVCSIQGDCSMSKVLYLGGLMVSMLRLLLVL